MNISEFKKVAELKEFNTNNPWGFGGSIDKRYKKGNLVLKHRRLCYRHAPSTTHTEYYIGSNEVTKKEFLKAISDEG